MGLYRVHAAACTSIKARPDFSCDDIAAAADIDLKQLITFNLGLNCAKLKAGQKLCITAGTLPKSGSGAAGANIDEAKGATNATNAGQGLPGQVLETNSMHWGDAEALKCWGYGVRRYKAQLLDIPSGTEWDDACNKTPLSISGLITYYDT
ncbi:hypothetical protein DXG01_016859 [Tephrocybe rancida]|nr:hypothetical protein DXG01_016859 [Tephrocybe rancida]